MGKVVAVMASPRSRGNSDMIVNSILDGAMGLSTNVIKLHRLDSLRSVHGCRACMACKSKGHCMQEDDLTQVLDDIRDADYVIFSTPVYFGGPSAQYKLLEDRMYSFFGSDGKVDMKSGRPAIIVVTLSGPAESGKPVADHIAAIAGRMGFDVMDTILYSDEGGTKPVAGDIDLLAKVKALGSNFRNT